MYTPIEIATINAIHERQLEMLIKLVSPVWKKYTLYLSFLRDEDYRDEIFAVSPEDASVKFRQKMTLEMQEQWSSKDLVQFIHQSEE